MTAQNLPSLCPCITSFLLTVPPLFLPLPIPPQSIPAPSTIPLTSSLTILLRLQEASTATYLLDLMVLCWDQQPRSRPSASQVVSTAAAPELTQLRDVVPLEQPLAAVTASALSVSGESVG